MVFNHINLFHRPLSVCKKDQCPVTTKQSCPAYKKLSVTPSECCDSYECVCDCQNIIRTCPPGYITKTTTNDCDCIEVTCTPDKVGMLLRSRCACVIHLPLQLHVLMSVLCNQHVIDYLYVQVCVVDAVVYQVGSRWEEKCKTCTCTEQADRQTGLHIAQCVDPVCNQICPLVRPFCLKNITALQHICWIKSNICFFLILGQLLTIDCFCYFDTYINVDTYTLYNLDRKKTLWDGKFGNTLLKAFMYNAL